jgi:hypothetical protein
VPAGEGGHDVTAEERRRINLALSILQGGDTDHGRVIRESTLALQGASIDEILRLREAA